MNYPAKVKGFPSLYAYFGWRGWVVELYDMWLAVDREPNPPRAGSIVLFKKKKPQWQNGSDRPPPRPESQSYH